MRTFEEFLQYHYKKNDNDDIINNVINETEPQDNGVSEEVVVANDIKNTDNIVDKIEKKSGYFFKNIIFFTNSRDASKNKTLKNLEDAVKGTDIDIFTFVAEEVDYKATDNSINIKDSKTKLKIDKQSNIDTIVIVRLGAQDSEQCVECIKELQEWGLFVLNPIQ